MALWLAFTQFSQHLLRDRLQRIKHARTRRSHRLNNRLALFLQLSRQIFRGYDIAEVALVQLQHVRNLHQIVALRLQILFEVVQRLDIGVHTLFLRIGHEHHSIDTLQNQFARRIVKNLTRHGVQVKARLEAANCPQLERHEIKEQRAISLGREADQLAARLGRGRIKDVLQVCRLTTQAWAVVDDLAVDFSRSVVDEGHSVPLAEKTVDVLVRNAGEGRIEGVVVCRSNFFEHLRQLMRNLLTPEFYKSETGALVEDDHEQQPADYGDMNALFFAFVRERREFLFSDQCSHSTGRRDITGSERRETGCVKISHFTLGCDLLTVLIYEKDHLG